MTQRNSSSRGGTTTAVKGRTAGSSNINSAEVAKLTADDIRHQLRQRGISGISALRKDDLVKSLVKTLQAEGRQKVTTGKASIGPPRKSAATKPATQTATKRVAGAKTTATTAGRATSSRSAGSSRKTTSAERNSTSTRPAIPVSNGGVRQGNAMSKSLKYAQPIASPDQRPDRPGRSLVTSSHEVIQGWAQARNAQPATIEGTQREGRAGVLAFNFPGWREGGKLRQITWDEWFETFDVRRLNFIYQETRSNGQPSNFFRTESPDREDG